MHENIQYIKCRFAPFSSAAACGIIDAFSAVWNHRPADHHPPTVAPRKTHSNALAVRCRQEPMSLICVPWYKMKSRTAIVPLKSRADKNYLADHYSDYVVHQVEKQNSNNLIMKCRPTCNNYSGRRWITVDKWHDQLKGNISEYRYRWPANAFPYFKGQGRSVESSTPFPLFETTVLPTTTHLLLHLTKHIQMHSPLADDKSQSR